MTYDDQTKGWRACTVQRCACAKPEIHTQFSLVIAQMTSCAMTLRIFPLFVGPNVIVNVLTDWLSLRITNSKVEFKIIQLL